MVPLVGVKVGNITAPLTARGAILHSGSALSLLTSKDYLYLGAVSAHPRPLLLSTCQACLHDTQHDRLFADVRMA